MKIKKQQQKQREVNTLRQKNNIKYSSLHIGWYIHTTHALPGGFFAPLSGIKTHFSAIANFKKVPRVGFLKHQLFTGDIFCGVKMQDLQDLLISLPTSLQGLFCFVFGR